MAYDASVDYKAKMNALKKQLETETDATKKAALQAEYDAADQSRMEKLASNLTTYGKYATGDELNKAAGIAATNQIGTQYEQQADKLNTYYDTAKQNASNQALSRGMARSSYVQDRMAGLDSDRAKGLSDIDASKALAIQNAKAAILDNYNTNSENALAAEKKEFADNIMAYYNDYQAEINKVQNDGDTSNDWKIPYLQSARNQKILSQQGAAATSGGSGTGTKSGTSLTLAQLNTALKNIKSQHPYDDGWKDAMSSYITAYGGNYTDALLAEWGLNGTTETPGATTPTATGTTGTQTGNMVNVPGYGNLSTTEALRLAESGVVSPYYDSNGNLAFSLVKGNKKTVNTTR